MSLRWDYQPGDAAQILASLGQLLPLVLPNLSQFLSPSSGGASQVTAYSLIAKMIAPSFEAHRLETMAYVDQQLAQHLPVLAQAAVAGAAISPEAKSFLLKAALDAQTLAVTSAPAVDPLSPRGVADSPATRPVMTALLTLHGDQGIRDLETSLLEVWNAQEQNAAEVFQRTLAIRSVTCNAILFGNLVGVSAAGLVFAILEQAALERLEYFSLRLSVSKQELSRPDHTRWFSYPTQVDDALRSVELEGFLKLNLFEFGAQLRKLRSQISFDPLDIPKPGQELSIDAYGRHLNLLSFLVPWLEALGFYPRGENGFVGALQSLTDFCESGTHHRSHVLEAHNRNMRTLYAAMLKDMHAGLSCFWHRRPPAYEHLMHADAMFLPGGAFYGTYRQQMAKLESINVFAEFGYGTQAVPTPAVRTSMGAASSILDARIQPAKRPDTQAKPDYSRVGSFAGSVAEDQDVLTIGTTKYSKSAVLGKLKLKPEDILSLIHI